jgi:hypothetical protein
MARIFWVAIERYDVFPAGELQQLLRNAHQITSNKLSKRTRNILTLPAAEQKNLILARRRQIQSAKQSR